jgi:hypothetical protein
MMLLVLNVIFGAAVGLRFKVFVLFPAILASMVLTTGIAAAQDYGLWPTLIAIVASITGIQVGFLGVILTRYFTSARQPSPLRASGSVR